MRSMIPARTEHLFDAAYDETGYAAWREEKLARTGQAEPPPIPIADPLALSDGERQEIVARCVADNFALYRTDHEMSGPDLLAMAAQLGLQQVELPLLTEGIGVTELSVAHADGARRGAYIPYTDQPLSWHTDGYNNPAGKWVRGMILHCLQPAPEGGALSVVDPDLAFVRLRDENPAWIDALAHPQALTIPANDLENDGVRGAVSGPVFATLDGGIVMRYTHRQRHAEWRDDPATRSARAQLRAYLESSCDARVNRPLMSGEGIISNNVLHRRDGFQNDAGDRAPRRILRARFRDRVDTL